MIYIVDKSYVHSYYIYIYIYKHIYIYTYMYIYIYIYSIMKMYRDEETQGIQRMILLKELFANVKCFGF